MENRIHASGMRNGIKRIQCAAAALLMVFCLFAGCAKREKPAITSLEQLNAPKTRIGVPSDLPEFESLKRDYPQAIIVAYSDTQLAYEDVVNGRLDAFVYSRLEMEIAMQNGLKGVRILEENYCEHEVAIGISPVEHIPDLQNKINTFLSELHADGTLDDMKNRWLATGDYKMPDIPKAENPTCRLRVGTTGNVMPFSFYSGTKLCGFDIEMAYRFALWLGATLEFKIYDFNGIVAAATTGDIDCIMSDLYVTEENSEAIPFSDPLIDVELTALVRDTESSGKIRRLADLEFGSIAVLTGSNYPEHVLHALPDSKLLYFNSVADEVNALKSGKADAAAIDEPAARTVMAQESSLTFLPDVLEELNYALIFTSDEEGERLRDRFNEYLAKVTGDGTLKALQDKWLDAKELTSDGMPDYTRLPDTLGTVQLAAFQNPPFSFSADGLYCGYEVELVAGFCREYGYALEVTDVNTDAIISAVQSGKYDIGCCGISITEERKESILFSNPDYTGGTVLLVRKDDAAQTNKNIWESVSESFYKTFIRENRWKLFLNGIGTTMLITATSVIAGTLVGFFVFMLCRKGNRFANALTRFFIWLIHGMPVVVLLMVLYYIVFGNATNVSGTVVSIIGFSLIFGAGVFSMLKAGVGAIDKGQAEAAYALGFTDRRTFFRVILPQALPHFMPTYKAEIVSLIKATAVVGYVAVQDLTKMGDIVRSRTYEAFFPLIAVAIIYFVLAGILTFIVKKIEFRVDPRRRSPKEILKGVKGK